MNQCYDALEREMVKLQLVCMSFVLSKASWVIRIAIWLKNIPA
jgi:hypothetical protein